MWHHPGTDSTAFLRSDHAILCVLFLHHEACPLTHFHFARLSNRNAGAAGLEIVPVSFSKYTSRSLLPATRIAERAAEFRSNPSDVSHRFHHAGGPLIPDLDCLRVGRPPPPARPPPGGDRCLRVCVQASPITDSHFLPDDGFTLAGMAVKILHNENFVGSDTAHGLDHLPAGHRAADLFTTSSSRNSTTRAAWPGWRGGPSGGIRRARWRR
jgi:hypothetical protein